MWIHEYIFWFLIGFYFWREAKEKNNLVYCLISTVFFGGLCVFLFASQKPEMIFYGVIDNQTYYYFGYWWDQEQYQPFFLVYLVPPMVMVFMNIILLIQILIELIRGREL